MILTRRTVANVLAGMEPQFRKTCEEFPGCCSEPAAWLVWSAHDSETHTESVRYRCHTCKQIVVETADDLVTAETVMCAEPFCAFEIETGGDISNLVRFIRL